VHRKARLTLAAGAAVLVVALALERLAPGTPAFVRGLLYGVGVGGLFAGLLMTRLPDPADSATPALRRRYLREFVPAMVAYMVTLLLSVWLLKQVDAPALRAPIALLPIPAVALLMRAMLRHIRDTDELQRRIEVESLSIATALVSLGYLGAGFLQAAKVIDIPSSVAMIWVFPLVCLVYGLAKCVVVRRYA
jgi:hypothetical protein